MVTKDTTITSFKTVEIKAEVVWWKNLIMPVLILNTSKNTSLKVIYNTKTMLKLDSKMNKEEFKEVL
jgi:hypothetical protein